MKKFSAKAFDAKFDAGDDIDAFVDWAKMRRPGRDTRRVNVDFPGWIVEALDREAGRLGVTRQALVKLWIAGNPATARARLSSGASRHLLPEGEGIQLAVQGR